MSDKPDTKPTFSKAQILELESKLVDAERESAETSKHGPANELVEFNATAWIRRLIDEVKARRVL
jgi:hypothetical protein